MAKVKSRVRIRDSDPGFKKLKKSLKGPDRVDIGVFAKQGSDLVIQAASNEFGTDHIPERSHLRAGIDEGKEKINSFIAGSFNRMFAGRSTKIIEIGRLGLLGTSLVVEKINKGSFVPNAPSTLRAKRPKTKPLINTTRMRNSYTHRVVK
jgi:hypothetical protein